MSSLSLTLMPCAVHHDNRDFTILPNYQPRGQSFDLQTVIGGVHPAVGYAITSSDHFLTV